MSQRAQVMSNGGQRLIVIPERKLSVAILCGAYNRQEISNHIPIYVADLI
jgi:hypothetical protein